MTIYNWLCLLCVPSLIGGFYAYVKNKIKKTTEETNALKLGIQALLRDRLLQGYRYFSGQGYASFADRDNWLNMYEQYHALGANGVMDDVKEKFLELPLNKC